MKRQFFKYDTSPIVPDKPKRSILQSISNVDKRQTGTDVSTSQPVHGNSVWLQRALKRKSKKARDKHAVDRAEKKNSWNENKRPKMSVIQSEYRAKCEMINRQSTEEFEAVYREIFPISHSSHGTGRSKEFVFEAEDQCIDTMSSTRDELTEPALAAANTELLEHASSKVARTLSCSKYTTEFLADQLEIISHQENTQADIVQSNLQTSLPQSKKSPSCLRSSGSDHKDAEIQSRSSYVRGSGGKSNSCPVQASEELYQPRFRSKEIDFFLLECENILLSQEEHSSHCLTSPPIRATVPRCYHALECQLITVKKKSSNKGKSFFACPLHMGEGKCDFFVFQEDHSPYSISRLSTGMSISKANNHVELQLKLGLQVMQNMTKNAARDETMLHNLKLLFGYKNFRQGQLWAIRRVFDAKNSILVLPTGAGKSLCYQYPVLFLPGVTLVISPLIALMQDQYEQLPAKLKNHAAMLSSTSVLRKSDWVEIITRLAHGDLKLLYVSPERAATERFSRLFTLSKVPISLLCLDEAHCISEWSHHFRPSYLQLCSTIFPLASCILALTATATQKVTQNLLSQIQQSQNPVNPSHADDKDYKVPDESSVMALPWRRSNLSIEVVRVDSDAERMEHLLHNLAQYLSLKKSLQGGLLIYVHRQRDTEILATCLEQQLPARCQAGSLPKNSKIAIFHAGIEADVKCTLQRQFLRGQIKIMIATIAFGMGIDRQNIRGVIHFHMPASIEAFVQQVGRAGRDQKPAFSICYALAGEKSPRRALLFHTSIDEDQLVQLFSVLQCARDISQDTCADKTARSLAVSENVMAVNLSPKSASCHFVLDIKISWLEKYVNMNIAMIRTFYALAELNLKDEKWKEFGLRIETSLSTQNQLCVVTVLEARLQKIETEDITLLKSIVSAIRSGKLSRSAQITRRNLGYLSELELQFSLLEMALHLYSQHTDENLTNIETDTCSSLEHEYKLWRAINDCRCKGSLKCVDLQVPAIRLNMYISTSGMINLQKNLHRLSVSVFEKHVQLQKVQIMRFEKLCTVIQNAATSTSSSTPIATLLTESREKIGKELELERELTRYFQDATANGNDVERMHGIESGKVASERMEVILNDIKVLVDGEKAVSWTATNIAKVLQGLSSPCFQYKQWRDHHLWRRYEDVPFEDILALAQKYLQNDATVSAD